MPMSFVLILYILVYCLYLLILVNGCQHIIAGDTSTHKKWIISTPILLISMVSLQYINAPQWFQSIFFFLLIYAIFFVIYRDNMYKSQFIMSAIILIQMTAHIIVQNLASLLTVQEISEIISNDSSRFITSTIALSLCILFMLMLNYIIPIKELRLIHTSKENMYFINQVVICSYLLLLTIFLFLYIQTASNYPQLLAIKSATASLLFFIIAVRYASNLVHNEMFKEKSTLIEEELVVIETKERRLKDLAYFDSLTKCYSREYALNVLADLFQTKGYFTLCFIDLDNLKHVNDTYGHHHGDQYIQAVTQILRNEIQTGYLCRYGGDEFLAILPMQNAVDGEQIMLKACIAVQAYSHTKNYPYTLSFSYGIAEKNDKQIFRYKNGLEMIQLADERMYHQKMKRKKHAQ